MANTDIRRGDSYDAVANAKLAFAVTKDYSTGWTGTMVIRHRVTGVTLLSKAVVVTSAVLINVTLAVTDTAFALLTDLTAFGPHPIDIQMVNGLSEQTAYSGIAIIFPN